MIHQDEQYRRDIGAAKVKHEDQLAAAAKVHGTAVDKAAFALAKAQREHDKVVNDATNALELASKQAHAELARESKRALDEWNQAERKALLIDPQAFIRKTGIGRLEVHASAGMPPSGSAWRQGAADEWVVDTEIGRSFVGGELAARRELWRAVVRRREQLETGELAG